MSAILVPFHHAETITVANARKEYQVPERTLRRWAEQHGVGRKIGGRVILSKPALRMYIEGDEAALGKYLRGDRSSPDVVDYFRRCNLVGILHGMQPR